jgi:D-hexose-6-phosphate mutarotase
MAGQPRVSWHSFRHTHATFLHTNGASLKTAQTLVGHSDLETTLNTYTHAVSDSQRTAVEQVAGVLFSDVLNSETEVIPQGRLNKLKQNYLREISGEPGRTRTSNPLIKSQLLYH